MATCCYAQGLYALSSLAYLILLFAVVLLPTSLAPHVVDPISYLLTTTLWCAIVV
jgi:hypothetical protein